jgi:CheY-like chemotaxis protein
MTPRTRASEVLRSLQAPLAGLSGLLHLLADTRLSAEQRRYVGMLRSSLLQIAVLVDDAAVLDARREPSIEDFVPAQLLETIRDAFLAAAHARHVELHLCVDASVPESLRGDAIAFRQLAFAALERAFAAAATRCEGRMTWQGDRLGFEVYADGAGAAADPAVHDPMAVAAAAAAEWAVETFDDGVRLATSVPATATAAAPSPPAGVVALRSSIGRHRVTVEPSRILVIEDQPSTRTVIRRILERAGHAVVEAATGEAALDLLSRETVDLIIVDLHLQDMSGAAMMREARAMEVGRRTPAIGISADDSSEALESIQPAGLLGLVPKPLAAERLLAAVAFALAPPVGLIAHFEGDPVIDAVAFADLTGIGDMEFVGRLVRQSIDDMHRCLASMREATIQLDMTAWREWAHALRGVALTTAASRLASAIADAMAKPDRDLIGKTESIEARFTALLKEADLALSEKLRLVG